MTIADYDADRRAIRDVITGYSTLVSQRVADGWRPYLVTMMFAKVSGTKTTMLARMMDEAVRVYSTFLPRVVRRPLSSRSVGELPIMVVAPDYPVGKRGKPLLDVVLNDGLHLHGILLLPPRSRLPVSADEHFRTRQSLYVRDRSLLDRIDVRPIVRDVERVVDYALKGLSRRRFSTDELFVLPRSLSEVRRRRS
jgi:hypothetical protein